MKLHYRFAALVLTAVLVSALRIGAAFGQSASASGSFSLQGKLTATNGTPIPDGMHSIVVKVYVRGNATAIFTETDTATTTAGIFNILVGHAAKLTLDATSNYEVGITLDAGAEMQPHVTLASSPRAMTASVSDTSMVAGLALNIAPGALGVVTSLNGVQGAVSIQGGGNIGVTTTGNTLALTFTGQAGGLLLPFTQALPSAGGLFNLTNTGAGVAATFTNNSVGGALVVRDSLGSAISAYSKGQSATIDVSNSGGVAINALSTVNAAIRAHNRGFPALVAINPRVMITNSSGRWLGIPHRRITATTNASIAPALIVKNTGSSGSVELFQALNAASVPVMDLSTTGLKLAAPADSAGAVLRLQNMTSINGNLIAAYDNTNSALFTLGSNGKATFKNTAIIANDTAGTAINALTYVANGPVMRLQNGSNAATAGLIAAVNGAGTTVFSVAGNGSTMVSASAAGATALTVSNIAGPAISATGNTSSGAALTVQNTSGAGTAMVLAARDSVGGALMTVGVNGTTTLRSVGATALDVATSAAGGTAAKITGGLSLIGPAGTATIVTGQVSVTVTNAFAKTSSIVLATVNSGLTSLVPIRVSATANGSFTVSTLVGVATTADLVFNYLIINTQ